MAEPTSTDGAPTGAENPGSPTAGDNAPVTFTQDQVNSAVQAAITERMARETSTRTKRELTAKDSAIAAFREEHGLDDERLEKLSGADAVGAELSTARLALQARDRDLEAATQAANGSRVAHHTLVKRLAIDSAARKSSAIEKALPHIASLLGARVAVTDDGKVEVLDEQGQPQHGATVDTFVAEFLSANDHFVAASTVGGGGGRPAGSDATGKIDTSAPGGVDSYYRSATGKK